MRRISRARSGLLVLACITALAIPTATAAETFSGRPVSGGAVLLEYGARYTAPDGEARAHQGLDIEADAGATVRACSDGDVVFAGPVPAGGGVVLAVTLACAGGLRMTLLPLDALEVRQGARVSTGDTLGTLRSDGDASSPRTHLHVGVRRGETYLDPAAFLPQEAVAVPAETPPAPSTVLVPAAHVVAEPVPVPVVAAHPVVAAVAPRPAGAAEPLGEPARVGDVDVAVRSGAPIARALTSPRADGVSVTRFERLRARTAADLPMRGREVGARTVSSIGGLTRATRRAAGRCVALTWAVLALWPVWRAGAGRAGSAVPVRVRA
ncbi:MAG: M23 family metallopeptidase [Coriobacteriia bacterium]